MRISDWSSDVCSSDLEAQRLLFDGADKLGGLGFRGGPVRLHQDNGELVTAHPAHDVAVAHIGQDRTCVEKGKSVSVRVDLGGRSIITKKKYLHNSTNIN